MRPSLGEQEKGVIECEYELRAGSDVAADVEEGNDEVSKSALQALSQGVQAAVLYQNGCIVWRMKWEKYWRLTASCITLHSPQRAARSAQQIDCTIKDSRLALLARIQLLPSARHTQSIPLAVSHSRLVA